MLYLKESYLTPISLSRRLPQPKSRFKEPPALKRPPKGYEATGRGILVQNPAPVPVRPQSRNSTETELPLNSKHVDPVSVLRLRTICFKKILPRIAKQVSYNLPLQNLGIWLSSTLWSNNRPTLRACACRSGSVSRVWTGHLCRVRILISHGS